MLTLNYLETPKLKFSSRVKIVTAMMKSNGFLSFFIPYCGVEMPLKERVVCAKGLKGCYPL
jgi:hypothetical protein